MKKKKIYVVRKYIKANSAGHAMRIEKKFPVDDVYMEEGFKNTSLTDAIGFESHEDEYEEEE